MRCISHNAVNNSDQLWEFRYGGHHCFTRTKQLQVFELQSGIVCLLILLPQLDGTTNLYIFASTSQIIFTFMRKHGKISKELREADRMISYEQLEKLLKERGISKTDLSSKLGISTRTIAKIGKGERLSPKTLKMIAEFLGTEPDALVQEKSDNRILQVLREEKEIRLNGGLYHELQVRMTYNSNHIEGSKLTQDQTRMIFETNTIDVGDGISVDDVMETVHHFRAIDYVIDIAEEELSEEIIKHLHYILKHDTKDSTLAWFAVGDYKKRANVVGGRETTKPSEVHQKMKALLEQYNAKENVTIEDIISLHAEFEFIHPFQDGNGRVGRLVALKECLRHQIVPFIIEDHKKRFYYRGLSEWRKEKGWLIETCLDGQDTFKKLLDILEIDY